MLAYDELLKKRRAVRHFAEKEVPESVVLEIIEDTCLAPSAGNRQPWEFVVVRSPEMIKHLSDESKANCLLDLEANPELSIKQYKELFRLPEFNVFYNAPCLVLIAGDRSVSSIKVDCALAAAYFMFAATSRGLGTCWVALGGNIRNPETLAQLGMDPSRIIIAPIILGYPTLIPDIPQRKPAHILKIIN